LKNKNKKGGVLTMVGVRIKGKMIRRKIVPLLFSIFIQFFFIGSVWSQGLVVVANPEAPNIPADYVKRIYLGFAKTLPDETPALPLVMKGTPDTFFQKVLGISQKDFKTHWLTKALAGEGIPPREVGADEIVNLVKTNRGAIGVVPADKARQEGLKILLEIK
jgi:ABC-type phosphate transport system substrate-binding protein